MPFSIQFVFYCQASKQQHVETCILMRKKSHRVCMYIWDRAHTQSIRICNTRSRYLWIRDWDKRPRRVEPRFFPVIKNYVVAALVRFVNIFSCAFGLLRRRNKVDAYFSVSFFIFFSPVFRSFRLYPECSLIPSLCKAVSVILSNSFSLASERCFYVKIT